MDYQLLSAQLRRERDDIKTALADLVAAARNAKGLLDNYLKYQEKGCLHRPEVLKTVDEVAAKVNKANELL